MTLFEKIIAREIPAGIVHEDDLCIAIRDTAPAAPVHIHDMPKKPIERIAAAADGDRDLLGHLLLTAARVACEQGLEESGYRLVINNGRDAGEGVPHLHIHILAGRPLAWPPG